GGKKHVCEACGKSFLRSDALKRHLKSSNESTRSKCLQNIELKGTSLNEDF
ncbi:hypothetical protein HDU98_009667, partial [Podochytrium sp. JEL0797]